MSDDDNYFVESISEQLGLILWTSFSTLVIVGIMLAICLLYTSPSPRDRTRSRMPSSA